MIGSDYWVSKSQHDTGNPHPLQAIAPSAHAWMSWVNKLEPKAYWSRSQMLWHTLSRRKRWSLITTQHLLQHVPGWFAVTAIVCVAHDNQNQSSWNRPIEQIYVYTFVSRNVSMVHLLRSASCIFTEKYCCVISLSIWWGHILVWFCFYWYLLRQSKQTNCRVFLE